MDRATDFEVALTFVTRRIEEEAANSGEPFTDQQRLLLNNLPSSSPAASVQFAPESIAPVPRDVNYERLCALARAARLNDLQSVPTSLDWEFASAVFRLNNHPMCSLLTWAGVKQYTPWWDRLLLVAPAIVFIGLATFLMFLVGLDLRTPFQWVDLVVGYLVIVFLMYFSSRQVERWQLEKEIDRCRLASRLIRPAM
jgi:hypothetical protein